MKYLMLDKYGWPIERIIGRPIHYRFTWGNGGTAVILIFALIALLCILLIPW